jgi:hypothetical protein
MVSFVQGKCVSEQSSHGDTSSKSQLLMTVMANCNIYVVTQYSFASTKCIEFSQLSIKEP